MEFKDILKNLRKESGLTQEQLAKKIDLSTITIRSYEAGRRQPNSEALVKLEDFFNVSGSQLHGIEDNQMVWDDSEIMDEVQASLAPMLQNILRLAQQDTLANKKSLYNILVELQAAIDMKNKAVRTLLLESIANDIHKTRSNINKITELVDPHN